MPPHQITVRFLTDANVARDWGAVMALSRFSREWRYLRCHNVDMLIDGEPVDLPEPEHDGDVMTGGVHESVSVRLDPATLGAILAANEIRVRVCRDAWTFTPRMMAGLVQFRETVFPPSEDAAEAPVEEAQAD